MLKTGDKIRMLVDDPMTGWKKGDEFTVEVDPRSRGYFEFRDNDGDERGRDWNENASEFELVSEAADPVSFKPDDRVRMKAPLDPGGPAHGATGVVIGPSDDSELPVEVAFDGFAGGHDGTASDRSIQNRWYCAASELELITEEAVPAAVAVAPAASLELSNEKTPKFAIGQFVDIGGVYGRVIAHGSANDVWVDVGDGMAFLENETEISEVA
jgi:hypothetical protein